MAGITQLPDAVFDHVPADSPAWNHLPLKSRPITVSLLCLRYRPCRQTLRTQV
jgi:hypothetical protein